jgi:ubiquinone/menaquinone biosynthesis C-methylase UbiE
MNNNSEHIKQAESAFWDYKYGHEESMYRANRDQYFHDLFKKPMRELPRPAKILEIACGARTDGIELARDGHSLTELDISAVAVERARAIFKSQNLIGEFVVGDAEHLPFADETFDAVFTAASFHHFPDPLAALAEMKRVTKNNGLIILGVEPAAWPYYTIYFILKPLKWLIRKLNPRPLNSIADDECAGFTEKNFRKLFKKIDIKILQIQRVKYLQEIAEQSQRLFSRLRRTTPCHPERSRGTCLQTIDRALSQIPILKNLNWHFNVIGKKQCS